MALKASRVDMWTVTVEDRAGGTADKLEALARAGANFEMVFARRAPEQHGAGILFVTPVKGAKTIRAAQQAGLAKAPGIHAVRVEGGDKPGLGSTIARALGAAGISFRGMTAVALGRKFACYLALDGEEDAKRAVSLLKKL